MSEIQLLFSQITIILGLICIATCIFTMGLLIKNGYKQYRITTIIALCMGIGFISVGRIDQKAAIKNHQSEEKIEYQKRHPITQTLTEKSISKTFQYDPDYPDNTNMDDSYNVNQQVNIYLNSIRNLKKYHISVITQQAKSGFLSSRPYSQTVTLIRKNI